MDVSISTTIFGEERQEGFDIRWGLEMIRSAGYRRIEFSRKHNNLSKEHSFLESLGLRVWSVHGSIGAEAISSDESIRRKTVEREIIRMEDASAYTPCPYVIHYLNRFNDPQVDIYWRKSVEELCEKAVKLSLNLSVETAPYKPGITERYPDSKEISGFVLSFHSPSISVCVDVNHSNIREDIKVVAENCSGLISNIHVSDNHGVREEHLPPGEGIIDFHEALRALVNAGYTGPCNLECHIEEKPTVEILRAMRLYAEKCIPKIG